MTRTNAVIVTRDTPLNIRTKEMINKVDKFVTLHKTPPNVTNGLAAHEKSGDPEGSPPGRHEGDV